MKIKNVILKSLLYFNLFIFILCINDVSPLDICMEVFEIEGGKKLSGTIAVGGLKNAATPIIAATLLSSEPSILENVPRIEDVFRMLEIVESLGATVEWLHEHSVKITPREIDPRHMDQEKVKPNMIL